MITKAVKSFSLESFIEKHPCVATMLLCTFSLFFTQMHQVARSARDGISGEHGFIWQIPVFVLFALLAYALSAFIKAIETNVVIRVVYVLGTCGATFLTFRLIMALSGTPQRIALLVIALSLFALFAFFIIKKNKSASILALAAALGICAVFGVGVVLLTFALVLYCLHIYTENENGIIKTTCTVGTLLLTTVAAYLCLVLIEAPKERLLVTGFILCFGLSFASALREKKAISPVIMLMFGLGLVMRFLYVLDITLPENQHDVFNLFSEHPRHNTYIMHIYNNWALPTEKVYNAGLSQYYHPPLHHFLAALWMRAQTACGLTVYQAYENVQYLTMAFSATMMAVGYKLFCEFKLKGVALYTAFAVLAFHPSFYIFAGSVNNDPLTTLFLFLSVLYTVRWYKKRSVKNTVILALTIGLGMMTKLSGAMIAFGTGYVFLYSLFTTKTGGFINNLKTLWKKFALFAAICFPLGLWWPIRCFIKYDMPLGYVPSLSQNSDMYLGKYSFLERLTGIGSWHLSNMYPNVGATAANGAVAGEKFYDYGIAPYIVKTSLFGEYFNLKNVSTTQNFFGYVLVFSALVLIAISLIGLFMGVRSSLKANDEGGVISKENIIPFIFLIVYYAFLVGSYVSFCFKYPHTCTMDFRYIVPTLLIGAVWSGLLVNGTQKWVKPVKAVLVTATVLFSFSSIVFYSISYIA